MNIDRIMAYGKFPFETCVGESKHLGLFLTSLVRTGQMAGLIQRSLGQFSKLTCVLIPLQFLFLFVVFLEKETTS